MVEQIVKEHTAALYGLSVEQMDEVFKTTFDMMRSTDKKTELIDKLVAHYGISKEAVMVCMSCGAMMV